MSAVDNFIIDNNGLLSDKFFKMQKDFRPDYVIEVGAHAAEFSLAMSEAFNVPAVAFEASPDVYKKFKDIFDNTSVSYLNYAISDVDGEEVFMVHENSLAGNNSIVYRNGVESMLDSYKVKSYMIDSYFKDIVFESACLWIDAEGANGKVLMGAGKTLDRVSSIFIETEDIYYWENQWLTDDVVSFLESQGFAKVDSEMVYAAQQNLIFVKKEILSDNKTS